MRKLDFNEYKLCQMHAALFEASIEKAAFSSPMFIRRFMLSSLTAVWDTKQYLILAANLEDTFEELNARYKNSTRKPLYAKNEMYWMGYVYRALVCLYGISSKAAYRMFPAPELRNRYPVYHTFDIEEAAERLMEGADSGDLTSKGVEILRRLHAETDEKRKAEIYNL